MKKIVLLFVALFVFSIPSIVNAGIKNTVTCENSTVDLEGKPIKICYIDIDITNTTKLYKIEGKLNFVNSSLKTITLLDSRFTMNQNDNNLSFTTKDAIEEEKVRIAKVVIYIATSGEECNFTWQPTGYGVNYSCEVIDGEYYDLNGKLTDFNTYDKQCNHYCEIIDDTYYGKNGNVVDEKTYDKECNKHTCEIIDNEYFDINGNIVTEKEYNKSCGKYTCVIVDNEYYNSEGKVVSEKEYNKDCGKYSCVIVDDEYYDEAGNLVDKETWETLCTIPENPTTGSESVIISIILGVITLIIITIVSKRNTKIYKI